jgi:hypothetical protein
MTGSEISVQFQKKRFSVRGWEQWHTVVDTIADACLKKLEWRVLPHDAVSLFFVLGDDIARIQKLV